MTSAKPREKLWRKGHRFCVYCGRALSCCRLGGEHPITADHVVPKSAGGSNSVRNLVASCFWCNMRKGSEGCRVNFNALTGERV